MTLEQPMKSWSDQKGALACQENIHVLLKTMQKLVEPGHLTSSQMLTDGVMDLVRSLTACLYEQHVLIDSLMVAIDRAADSKETK